MAVNKTRVCAALPYYNAYKSKSEYFSTAFFEWSNMTVLEASSGLPVIQVMTSPNNPDGSMRNKTVAGGLQSTGSLPDKKLCLSHDTCLPADDILALHWNSHGLMPGVQKLP